MTKERAVRILHLEDLPIDSELVLETLAAAGVRSELTRVDTRSAFLEALEKGGFDLILSDFSLPGFSGASALEEASRIAPEVPFVFLSGTLGEEKAVDMLKRGANDYVLKDRPARLSASVKRALREAEERGAKRRAEEELRKSEEFVRRLAEASPNALSVFDLRENKVVFIDGAVERVFGYRREQLLEMGPTTRQQIHPEDLARMEEHAALYAEAADGEVVQTSFRIRGADGSWRWVEERSTVFLREPDGTPRQTLSIMTDVTAEKRNEQQRSAQFEVTRVLAESHALAPARPRILRAICESLGFVVGEWWERESPNSTLTLRETWDSGAAAAVAFASATRTRPRPDTGLPSRALSGVQLRWTRDSAMDPAFPRAAIAAEAGLQAAIAFPLTVGGVARGSILCLSPDLIDLDEGLTRKLTALGSQIGDFIVRKEGEDALRRSQERFELVAQATNDAIWDWDVGSGRVWWNEAVTPLFGYGRGDVAPSYQWWAERIHPADSERVLSEFEAVVKHGGRHWSGEYRFRRADGSYATVNDRAFVLRDAGGAAVRALGSMTDVTEKKRLEEQALRNQRMESLGTLASGIAHDLNNVLSPILMAAPMLRPRLADERGRRLVDTIETTAQRGGEIVKQILAFARGAETERRPLQLRHVLRELERIIRETFPRTVQLRIAMPKQLWSVLANATQLHQLLLNLCVNARDAMPDGGVLSLSGENQELDALDARIHPDANAGRYVVLYVSDTGSGIPKGLLDRIFEPFFTTKEAGRGTGLGLSTCLTIVKAHDGFISVYSELHKGTTFRVYLPALQEGAGTASEAEGAEEAPLGHGETILVVDDDAAVRQITRETLESHGYKVVSAGDGAEAVAIYAQARDAIDLVVTDWAMPLMDGAATIRALRRIDPGVRILAMSGLATNEAQAEHTAGAAPLSFLQKPFTARGLLRAVRGLL